MTVHLVYVNEPSIGTHHSIAREVAERLRNHYKVEVHHPNDPITVRPEPGDVLIGHPNRYGVCAFRRSFGQPGWRRRIVFAPFSVGMLEDAAAIDDLVCEADVSLAVTGQYWLDALPDSLVSHWGYKMMRCDLGVNRQHYPQVKSRFRAAGQRRFLYIGSSIEMKGGDFLAALADANPDIHVGWISTGDTRHCLDFVSEPSTRRLGERMRSSRLAEYRYVRWRSAEGMRLVSTFDFILICGRSDALPCEALECASYGLVPVTTPQCGFPEDDWMTHLPLDDVEGGSAVLRRLSGCPEEELIARQTAGFRLLESRYNWDCVARQVRDAIESPIAAPPDDPSWRSRREANQRRLRSIRRRHNWSSARDIAVHRVKQISGRLARRMNRLAGR